MIPSLTALPSFNKRVTLEHTASIIRQGQSRCLEEHKEFLCSRQTCSFAPTRLISTGTSGAPLRLIKSPAATGPYATLSYCWGGAKPPSTTTANIAARFHNIPEDSLPIVFREAIQLARMLEIPYIWIDSLCIIQDSVEDWEAESQRMHLYYRNGSVNIAAATSQNPDTPLTKPLDDMWSSRDIKVHDLQGKPWVIHARLLPNTMQSLMDLGPLYTRAWTFQESLFAPRTINFTSQGLVWSCSRREPMSHSYLDGSTLPTISPRVELPDSLSSVMGDENDELHEKTLGQWRNLVSLYSSRSITFATDKLPAISGAAAMFHQTLRCRYLAGHWYEDLPQSLLWFSLGLQESLTPMPREYVAPSWSWASFPQGINWKPGRASEAPWAPRMMAVDCDVSETNTHGRVHGGFIEIRGKTIYLKMAVREGVCHWSSADWDFFPDGLLKQCGESVSRAVVGDPLCTFEAYACGLYMTSEESNYSTDSPLVTHQLLVLGWLDPEHTVFTRVGILESKTERGIELFNGEKTADEGGAVERTVRII